MATQSLAELLNVEDPRPVEDRPTNDFDSLVDLKGREFCEAFLQTREFRQYLMNGLALGDISPAILGRIMDQVWGKAPDRVELTGKNGGAIETITEVRRVIVHAEDEDPYVLTNKSTTAH